MTQWNGEVSPTERGSVHESVTIPLKLVDDVSLEASVSPSIERKEFDSLSKSCGPTVVGHVVSSEVVDMRAEDFVDEVLAPVIASSSWENADGDDEKFEGETFGERMARLGIAEGDPTRAALREEFQQACAAARREVAYRDDDGAIVFDQGGGEHRGMRLPPGVPVPSAEMVRRHRAAGHSPYRPWCRCCVEGAANAPAHRPREERPIGDIPELHSDYGFFRDRKGDRENTATVLVTRDRKSSGVCAHVVPRKGAGGGYIVKQYDRDVKKLGYHHKILIRSDGEPAIKDLLNKVAELRAPETVLENSPAGDSKANGRAERAVQAVEKQTRVLKIATEENLGEFGVRHPGFTWLVEHAADVITKFNVGSDGLTAFERIKGRAYSGLMMEFGQAVLYKNSAKVQGGNMEPRWSKGIWLGKRFATEEHLIGTVDGVVVRCGAVKPHPETQWDSHLFDALVGVPWDPAGKNKDVAPADVQERLQEIPRVVVPRGLEDEIPQPRRILITRDYLNRFGYTPGCSKCTAIEVGDNTHPTLAHSAACRSRIERELEKDPFLSKRLEKAKLRQSEFLARRVEAGDPAAKRMRSLAEESGVELQPGPGGASESRRPDVDPHLDGEPAGDDDMRSNAPSTVTCVSDLAGPAEEVDIPMEIAGAGESGGTSSANVSQKRSANSSEGPQVDARDEGMVEDPVEPSDEEAMVGMLEAPSVYMLGERHCYTRRKLESTHPGKYDICELFSQPRVSATATKRGLRGGWSLDLLHTDPVTGSTWDLSDKMVQDRVWKLVRRDKPLVIGLSPECTLFSALQNLRKTEIPRDDLKRAMDCVRFCVEIANYQRSKHRYFYFEHPLTASSWTMPELQDLMGQMDVESVVLHMCAFGLTSSDALGEGLVKKPTRVLTNMPGIATALDRKCSEDHRHVQLMNGRAKAAAHYSDGFCNAIVDGIKTHLEYEALALCCGRLQVDMGELENLELADGYGEHPFCFDDSGYCVDDIRGGELPMELVRQGRLAEMNGFHDRRVYEIRPRTEAVAKGAKVVGVRWVDTMKGSVVRSRLVCQDYNNDKAHTDEMFAPTPPLAASRWLCSCMASESSHGLGRLRLMALDFSKAFLYGDMKREVYINLPAEDPRKHDSDSVGLLRKSMYGLRDAPQIWQEVVRSMLEARGFQPLVGTQCMYVSPATGMLIVAHVDDFLVLGSHMELQQLLKGLQKDYECTGQILGIENGDVQQLKFLGRTITLTDEGLEWEGDRKHVLAYLDKLNADFSSMAGGEVEFEALRGGKSRDLKGVKTPGVKKTSEEEERIPLSPTLAKSYRGLVALANFMAQDRADISFASKEVSKFMSSPAECDIAGVKRLGRYLVQWPRCVSCFRWQEQPDGVHAFSDSDWGGDQVSRRSTSGGCILRGTHLMTHWSRTQQVISLSSAEAELHALCKCASEGLCIANMSKELLMDMKLRLLTDSSAARGIVQRQGAGKVKHLDVKSLWIQEREATGDLVVLKIPRLQNWSDLMTHHWSEIEGERHLSGMGVERR